MKYTTYYDTPENKAENRKYVLAATNKIDYICGVLNRIGHSVEIVSASCTSNRRGCAGKTVQLSDKTVLKLFPCIGRGNLPKRLLGRLLFKAMLFLYLITHTQKDENILVYHSLGYAGVVTLARRIKEFRLILEVEEIYADVNGKEQDRKKEYKVFAAADAYVFPTKLLHGMINSQKKPYAIIHGTYRAEPDRGAGFDDNRIHVLYAGTFDPRKGGAAAAASAAAYLPEQYHIHILGFGSEKDKRVLLDVIQKSNLPGHAAVTYDGLLSGEEYIRFVQSCDIGLSTQSPDAAFNATSFPSKILSYMANGLRVVSIRIEAVEQSAVSDLITYYDVQSPEEIAKAIMHVDLTAPYDSRRRIAELDRQFAKDLTDMIEGLDNENEVDKRQTSYNPRKG